MAPALRAHSALTRQASYFKKDNPFFHRGAGETGYFFVGCGGGGTRNLTSRHT